MSPMIDAFAKMSRLATSHRCVRVIARRREIVTLSALFAIHLSGVTTVICGADSRQMTDDLIWRTQHACGANCLYVLLKCADLDVPYMHVRDSLPKDRDSSLADLRRVAAEVGLPLSIAKLRPVELASAPMPMIAHVEPTATRGESSGHFIVLLRVDEERCVYIDGSTAELKTRSREDLLRDWTGYAAYATPSRSGHLLTWLGYGFAGMALTLVAYRMITRPHVPPFLGHHDHLERTGVI
jgi:hypothetical protein